MRCNARQYARLARHGPATAVSVRPTGTAVTEYQVSLGNRHSLKEAGVIGLPSWSDKTTQSETWTKVPRLSATCPRRVVVFDGGRGSIDKTMEFGDEFGGSALDAAKWTVNSGQSYAVADGAITVTGANDANDNISSVPSFGPGTAAIFRAKQVRYTTGESGSSYWGYRSGTPETGACWNTAGYGYWAGATHYTMALHPDFARWEIIRNGATSVIFSKNRGDVQTVTSGLSSAAVPVALREYLGGATPDQMVVDSLFVRKYTPNEPITGTAAPSATNRALSRPMSHADLMRACCT